MERVTRTEVVRDTAVAVLLRCPEGLTLGKLVNRVKSAVPDMKINTIRSSLWDLHRTRSTEVDRIGPGFVRHASFRPPEGEGIVGGLH